MQGLGSEASVTVAMHVDRQLIEFRRHRRFRLAIVGATVLAAIAAGTASALRDGAANALTARQIAAREAAALGHSDRYIAHLSATTQSGPSESWVDFAQLRTRTIDHYALPEAGQTLNRYFVHNGLFAGEVTTQQTYNNTNTWVTYDGTHLPRTNGNPQPGLAAETPTEAMLGSIQVKYLGQVAVLRSGVDPSSGETEPWTYRVIGTSEVDGQHAVELETRMPAADLAALAHVTGSDEIAANTRYDVWISTTSYLPIREQTSNGSLLEATVDIAWLAATRANRAFLTFKAPRGLRHTVVNCNESDAACPFAVGG